MLYHEIKAMVNEMDRISISLQNIFDVGCSLAPSCEEQDYRKEAAHPLIMRMNRITVELGKCCAPKAMQDPK